MYRIVIPARFGSTRLPGKPLLEIAGKPMLQWVYERAADCLAEEVVIATDDERIMQLAAGFGASAVLTSRDHASGTDRIAEVAALRGWTDEMVVVNLQGDEPGMPAELIEQVAGLLLEQPHADVATLAVPVREGGHGPRWAGALFQPCPDPLVPRFGRSRRPRDRCPSAPRSLRLSRVGVASSGGVRAIALGACRAVGAAARARLRTLHRRGRGVTATRTRCQHGRRSPPCCSGVGLDKPHGLRLS